MKDRMYPYLWRQFEPVRDWSHFLEYLEWAVFGIV